MVRGSVGWIVGAVAVLVAGLVSVIGVSLSGPSASATLPPWAVSVATSDDPFTRTPIPGSLICPADVTLGPNVRIERQITAPADHLVPEGVPGRGLVCQYRLAESTFTGPAVPQPLRGSYSVTGDLSQLAETVRAPSKYDFRAAPGRSNYVCLMVIPTFTTSRYGYLIGLEYPAGIVWWTDEDSGSDGGRPAGDPSGQQAGPGTPCDYHATNGAVSVDTFGPALT